MDPDDGLEDDGPVLPWLPPDDRLWRHPSELFSDTTAPVPTTRLRQAGSRVWAAALLAGVVGAVLATGVAALSGSFDQHTTVIRPVERVVDTTTALVTPAANPKTTDVVRIAARLRPAIVQLQIDGDRGKISGSGVVFRSDGYVLTNSHVVEGAGAITAIMPDGTKAKGTVVGADRMTDIAVVRLSGPDRPFATLGTATSLKVGQLAVAIGSPLGLAGGPSVTVGIVSALGRQVGGADGVNLLNMIQTDAAIAPGSSGGALVDDDGNVIGITTAVAVTDGGPAFAIPIDIAHDVAEQLMSTGHATHVWLGVQGDDVDDDLAVRFGIGGGALVKGVLPGSPAAKAGITPTDVIVDVGGEKVQSMGALALAMRIHRPGDRISLGVIHAGRYHTVRLSLVEQPPDAGSS